MLFHRGERPGLPWLSDKTTMTHRGVADRTRRSRRVPGAESGAVDKKGFLVAQDDPPARRFAQERNRSRPRHPKLGCIANAGICALEIVGDVCAEDTARDVVVSASVCASPVRQPSMIEQPASEMGPIVTKQAHSIAGHVDTVNRIVGPVGCTPARFGRGLEYVDRDRSRGCLQRMNGERGARKSSADDCEPNRLIRGRRHCLCGVPSASGRR